MRTFTSFLCHNLAKMICIILRKGSHETGCGSTPFNMWSFVAFIWTCCFLEDTWAPLKRRHGLLLIREAVGCFGFDEQEVHMYSTKNVNKTHSSQFLMETSLDLGIRRWREMGSCIPLLENKKNQKTRCRRECEKKERKMLCNESTLRGWMKASNIADKWKDDNFLAINTFLKSRRKRIVLDTLLSALVSEVFFCYWWLAVLPSQPLCRDGSALNLIPHNVFSHECPVQTFVSAAAIFILIITTGSEGRLRQIIHQKPIQIHVG